MSNNPNNNIIDPPPDPPEEENFFDLGEYNEFDEFIFEEGQDEDYDPDNSPLHHLNRKNKQDRKKFSGKEANRIRVIYILFIIVWLIVIYWGRFYSGDYVSKLILAIPIAVFSITYANVEGHTTSMAKGMLKGNILSFMFLTVSLLLNWFKIGDKRKVYRAMIAAVLFIVLSLIDFWVDKKDVIYVIHIKSISQTLALTLLAYSLYVRYSDNVEEITGKKAATLVEKSVESAKKANETLNRVGGIASTIL